MKAIRTAETAISLLSALLLLGAAFLWLVVPAEAVGLFGIPLEGKSFPAYGTLKGIEDLVPALMIVLFVRVDLVTFDSSTTLLFVTLLKTAVTLRIRLPLVGTGRTRPSRKNAKDSAYVSARSPERSVPPEPYASPFVRNDRRG